ncbi:hypothetical protein BKA69DRAFT_1056946 [Paraphysoderma sedebokerense]|nr:hypothetical protein BKA69DRAFT_1056946 [Paraphysoderma sedebokerense]
MAQDLSSPVATAHPGREAHVVEADKSAFFRPAQTDNSSVDFRTNIILSNLLSVLNSRFVSAFVTRFTSSSTSAPVRAALVFAGVTCLFYALPLAMGFTLFYFFKYGPHKMTLDVKETIEWVGGEELQRAADLVQSEYVQTNVAVLKKFIERAVPNAMVTRFSPHVANLVAKVENFLVYAVALLLVVGTGTVHLFPSSHAPLKRKHEEPSPQNFVFVLDEPEIRKRRRKSKLNQIPTDGDAEFEEDEGDLQDVVNDLKVNGEDNEAQDITDESSDVQQDIPIDSANVEQSDSPVDEVVKQ